MQLTINIPDETAALLQSRGVKITALLEETVAREAQSASHQRFQSAVRKGQRDAENGNFVATADVWARVEAALNA